MLFMKRLCVAGLLAGAPIAGAQVVVDMPVLSREGVERVLRSAEAAARQNGWAVSIAVTDPSGLLLAFARLDNAPPSSIEIAIGKGRTAALFRRPSKAIEDLAATRAGFIAIEGIIPLEGGLPITVGDRVVGAIGVSGVTSVQDAQVARAGAESVLRPRGGGS